MDFQKLRNEYEINGFVVVPSFFDEREVKNIEHELLNFISNHAPNLKRDEINFSSPGVINSIHRLASSDSKDKTYFTELLLSEKLGNLAEIFLNDKSDPRQAEFFGKPAKVGLKSPWHQDNFYWGVSDANALTIWLAIDDCDETNGGITYIKGSHHYGIVDHIDSFAPGSSQMVRDKELTDGSRGEIVTPVLRAGDVVIHHSLTIHGSQDNRSNRSRRGLTFQFKGKNSTYDQEMIRHYLERLNLQVDMRQK
jgi:phytanoyl-CoA hydroxylase